MMMVVILVGIAIAVLATLTKQAPATASRLVRHVVRMLASLRTRRTAMISSPMVRVMRCVPM